MKVENTTSSCFELCFDSKTEELKINHSPTHPKNYYNTSSCFELCFDSKTEELKINHSPTHPSPTHPSPTHPSPTHPSPTHPKNYYTLRYFYNPNKTFFRLFMHTSVYDKLTNENIEKQGILLRSWNPITKRGERYIFRKGEEGDGDLNLKRVYLPNTKTIFKFARSEDVKEESYKLAEEIIKECPHKDIELKFSTN